MDFSQYTNGNILNLCGNINIDELVKFLQRNTRITCLDLACCEIKAEGIKELANLPQNITSLDLSENNIGAEGVAALAQLKLGKRLIVSTLQKRKINQFYNALVESYNKGEDGKLEDTNFVRDLVFYFALCDNTGNNVKYLLSHPEKYPFLINSKDKYGRKLSHFYTHSPKMQKFLFEHGLIPKKDEELQRIIADNQSVHDSAAVKKTNFIVKELVKSFKANQDELKQAADSYLLDDIPELLKPCQDNLIRIKLLSLTENEKRSVMKKTLSENNPIPDDQQFIKIVMNKAKEALETQYLRKKKLVNMIMDIQQIRCSMMTQIIMQKLLYLSL